jgi:hypothetical protein
MNTTNKHASNIATASSLAFHIRRRRHFHGDRRLSQAELAAVAGVCPRVLRSYERTKSLPRSVRNILTIALALEIPVEELIAPSLLAEMRRTVEKCCHSGRRKL